MAMRYSYCKPTLSKVTDVKHSTSWLNNPRTCPYRAFCCQVRGYLRRNPSDQGKLHTAGKNQTMSIEGARGGQGKKRQDSLLQGSPHGHRAPPRWLSTQPSSALPAPCLGQSNPRVGWEAAGCNPCPSGGRDGRTGAGHAADSLPVS